MTTNRKKYILSFCVIVGLILILIVVFKAHAAKLQTENNQLISENLESKGEVDTIKLKIKAANSIENVEKVASNRLGMVYPKEGEFVYLSKEKRPKENLALKIRSNAFN